MSRVLSEVSRRTSSVQNLANQTQGSSPGGRRSGISLWALRICLIVGLSLLAAVLHPFGLSSFIAGIVGFFAGSAILAAEMLLTRVSMGGLLGATLGLIVGLLISAVTLSNLQSPDTRTFLESVMFLGLGFLGLVAGIRSESRIFSGFGGLMTNVAETSAAEHSTEKLLDTSVLIDGRIADICETHFLDGPLLVPQFILKELQVVADSSDTLKRQRGRRGLEVLQRMQKMAHLRMRIVEEDAPQNADVDHKLIELALRLKAKIVTNDFNLNKVASVQGVGVLNVNELANALRPAVLPGEAMRVFILREGKEANQGVAYLEDGTMVVVDGARRLINRTVDILVTSVHQTPAGKMIFGRLDERGEQSGTSARQAAAGGERGSRTGLPGGGDL
ncbi:MAG TPA: TRAM domain-containing protein [Terriglobales bacterium]|nr:TRAM domain-containing protein [Terriglobales bacterium]